MDYNYITENHDYNAHGYIGLVGVRLANVPNRITYHGIELHRKNEFHISIICVREIAQLIDPMRTNEIEKSLVDDFLTYQAENPLTQFTFSHDYYLVRKSDRITVIGLVAMPSLEEFFSFLSQKYDRELPLQPGHITMFTLDEAGTQGIGILSDSELSEYGEPVIISELSNVEAMS